MAALLGVLFLIVATFGFLYWRAVYGPGSSKNLPPVPMPGMAGSAAVPVQPASGAIVVAPGAAPRDPQIRVRWKFAYDFDGVGPRCPW